MACGLVDGSGSQDYAAANPLELPDWISFHTNCQTLRSGIVRGVMRFGGEQIPTRPIGAIGFETD